MVGGGQPQYYEAGLFNAETVRRRWRGGLADRDRFDEASRVNQKNSLNLKGVENEMSMIPKGLYQILLF